MTDTKALQTKERLFSREDRWTRWNRILDLSIVVLFFIGVVITPIHLRAPILFRWIGYTGHINFPCILAVCLSFFRVRRWEIQDVMLMGAWLLLLIPMMLSNLVTTRQRAVTAVFQNLFPAFIVFYRMEPANRKRAIRIWLDGFNVFIVLLLILGIVERFSGLAVIKGTRDWLLRNGFDANEISGYILGGRFATVWGHPLTIAMFFNIFFILNVLYRRQNGLKCPVILYFVITLAAMLLTGCRSGLVICFALLVIFCWKQKKWFLLAVPVVAILYFAGAFNLVISRFADRTLLTDDRVKELTGYFASGLNPLQWLTGYGSNGALRASSPVYMYNDGFEFPLMMYAYDYGIIFSLVRVLGMYGYITWRFLRKRQWLLWIGYSILFAQLNVYNGYSMRNQDICYLMDFIGMIMVNMIPEEAEEGRHGRHEARAPRLRDRMDPLVRKALPATLSLVLCAWITTWGLMYIHLNTRQPLSLTWGTLQRREVIATEVAREARQSFEVREEITAEKMSLIPYLWDTTGSYTITLRDEAGGEALAAVSSKFPIKKSGKEQELTLERPVTLVPGRTYQLDISVQRKEASKSKKAKEQSKEETKEESKEETAEGKSPFTGFALAKQEGTSFIADGASEAGTLCFSLTGVSRDLAPLRVWAIAIPSGLLVCSWMVIFLLLPWLRRRRENEGKNIST